MASTPRRLRRARGLTLIECAVSVGIAAVVLGMAAPGFASLRERERLRAVAAQLETDVAFARSLAVAQSDTLRLEFGGARCWVLHDGPPGCNCDADGRLECGERRVLRVMVLGADHPVQLQSNSRAIAFDDLRGTVTPTATVRLSLPDGSQLNAVVNLMGRVRLCSPSGLPGYAAC
ncbi:GspH/FimT family pseudopilin [Rubrivivax gelatinosus]|uniref:Type II secretion system protein H n=1 Tax=Rubrivivax gelatinosus TaxID=28068 RepID=A0ABS1DW38_RUBGE|nr:GspH/FimT family pseudopilin [Rubrivivax gelatinosus]MBK1713708.1 fimbrial assembly protein [Rubrivivax gelatinosus]